jgi:YggT family protein
MLGRIATLLVDTVVVFFVFMLLLRFHFQWLRVPFRNQFGEFVVATTNWLVRPARRVLPGIAGLDLATLIAAWILQALGLWILTAIAAVAPSVLAVVAGALVDLLRYSLYILVAAVVIQAVLSWVNPYTPMAPVLDTITRPFLRPIRRFMPPVANFDLTPAVLLLIVLVLLIPMDDLRKAIAGI